MHIVILFATKVVLLEKLGKNEVWNAAPRLYNKLLFNINIRLILQFAAKEIYLCRRYPNVLSVEP
jgi:hypothetical protein